MQSRTASVLAIALSLLVTVGCNSSGTPAPTLSPDGGDPLHPETDAGPGAGSDGGACVPLTCEDIEGACGDHVSDGCTALLDCGTCSAGTCGGGGTAHRCGCGANEVLAEGQDYADNLVRDGDTFYWTTSTDSGSIWRRVGEGEPELLDSGQTGVENLAFDATYLYWATATAIVRRPKAGGSTQTLVSGLPHTFKIAVDATHVYYTTDGTHSDLTAIVRVPKAGGATSKLDEGPWVVTGLVVDATHIYFVDWTGNGIYRRAKASGPTSLWLATTRPNDLVLDGDDVYWYGDDGKIQRRPKAGGVTDTLASGVDIANLVVGGGYVVWAGHHASASVKRKALAGGAVETIASGDEVENPSAVDTDGTYVYWTDEWKYTLERQAPCD